MSAKSGAPVRSLLTFFGVTFAVSWVLWGLASLVPPGTPFRTSLFLPGTFAPAFVAFWLTSRTEGRPVARALVERVFKWRVPARWYAFAFLYVAAIKLAAAIAHRLALGIWPPVEQGSWFLYIAAIITSTPFQAGEEIGWRGFALPRLSQRLGLGGAALVLGVIWATWHLPLFFIAATDTTGVSFLFYLVYVTAISVAIAWLYARTGGSLLQVMLLHAAANNTPHFVERASAGGVFGFDASMIQLFSAIALWIGTSYFLVQMRNVTLSEQVPTRVS